MAKHDIEKLKMLSILGVREYVLNHAFCWTRPRRNLVMATY
jgi:hypothetical protein